MAPERIRCKDCKDIKNCICKDCKTVCGFGASHFYVNCKPLVECNHFVDWVMYMTGRKK